MTDQVRKQPYSLVLLDEIEKADSQMLNLFLQVFDAGRLTDGKGRTVHFNNTTIVMTSNVGTHLYGQARAGYAAGGKTWNAVGRSELEKEIKRFFPPEFLNRIDEIVFFLPLTELTISSGSPSFSFKERPRAARQAGHRAQRLRAMSTRCSSTRVPRWSTAPATWRAPSEASHSRSDGPPGADVAVGPRAPRGRSRWSTAT